MKIKRILSIVLVAFLISTILPAAVFAQGTVTISGEAKFISAPAGKYSKLTYTATYSNGIDADVTDPTAFTWEVTKDGAIATDVFCVDGELIVAGGSEGAYTLFATHTATAIKSAGFDIVVTKSTAKHTGENILAATNTKLSLTLPDSQGITSGIKSVTFKFRVPSSAQGTSRSYITEEKGWKESIKVNAVASSFTLYRNYSGSNYIKNQDGENVVFNYDTWYEFTYVYDMTNSKYSVYINGKPCKVSSASWVPFASGMSSHNYYVYNDVCDAVAFSGIEFQPNLNIEDVEREIIIPQSATGKACVQLYASSVVDGTNDITWSIPATPGVSIDENTGLVTITNAASAGIVKVTATQNGKTAQTDIVLNDMNEDFESYEAGTVLASPWQNSNVASDESGNKYNLKTSGQDYIGWYFTRVKDVAKAGSTVVEFKFKGSMKATLRRYDTPSNNWSADSINFGTSANWATAKLVYNNTPNTNGKLTVTALLNNNILFHNVELTFSGVPDRIVINNTTTIDDFKVYGVDFAAPEARNVTLADVAPGSELALSYRYYNEGSVAENGTEITWAYADSKDSANWTVLPEYDGKLAIDAAKTAQLDGKYVKAVVTPKCVNPYTNEVVAGAPVEKVVAVSDMILSPYCTIAGEVFDIDNDTLAAGQMLSYTLAAKQIEENATTYMVVMAKYTADGKELLHADVKELTTQKGVVKEVSVALEKEEGTMIKVFVWKKANLSPVIFKIVK